MSEPHILHVFPSFEVGGLQLRAAAVMQGLGAGYRHSVVSLSGNLEAVRHLAEDINVEILAAPETTGILPLRLLRIRKFLQTQAADLVITHNWGSIEWVVAARLLPHQPVLHLEAGFGADEAQRFMKRRVLARRLVLRGRQVQISVPSHTLWAVATQTWGLHHSMVREIVDGIDYRCFSEATPTSFVPKLDGSTLCIGTVAILRQEKNLGVLLSAFKHMPHACPAQLVIVGDGPEREALEINARELGVEDRVVFTGYTDKPEQAQAAFDIFAITSSTEQVPNSVIQAMAAGKPIVGMEAGDISSMVSAENRPYIVPQGDSQGLIDALTHLLREPSTRTRLGAANQLKAKEQYSSQAMFEAYREIIDQMIAGRVTR
jgi:L-malate glycosyltransferase